jgi:segregation and condensation protein B
MYATTRQFLDYFNLKSLDQLPALAEIRDLETLNAELGFSEPLTKEAGSDTAGGVDMPELTVVGGTEHTPPLAEVSAPPVTLSEAADELQSRAASADFVEQKEQASDVAPEAAAPESEPDSEEVQFEDGETEDEYPGVESTKPESQA